MSIITEFNNNLTHAERRLMDTLQTPAKIQNFLDVIPYSTDHYYRCPLRVLRERVAHCFDGALFAAAALYRVGYAAVIIDMIPSRRDDDHVLALFKMEKHWGAIAKSNFTGLRFREPIFRNLRELILSYFEQYYNTTREKTLRGYTRPLDLKAFDQDGWMYHDQPLELIAKKLDKTNRFPLLTKEMISRLQPVDPRSHRAGLVGAAKKGLFKPDKNNRSVKK